MKIQTIGDALLSASDPYEPDSTPHRLYLIRHSSGVVIYVGQTFDNPKNRLARHVGGPLCAGSAVGQAILDNLPESNCWLFEMLTLEDCIPVISKHRIGMSSINCVDEDYDQEYDVDVAEAALIAEHGPCFNSLLTAGLSAHSDCPVARSPLGAIRDESLESVACMTQHIRATIKPKNRATANATDR